MSEYMIAALLKALWDTLVMVSISGVIVWFLGVALAVVLVVTSKGGIFEAVIVNKFLGWFVNGFRAMPFIILLVALIPVTRLITGTTIGVWAAVVPITISSTPFFARVVELSLREVGSGVIEAAEALGCHRRDIIIRVMLPEALPGIIGGFTLTLVAMVGASAMAGAIGAGGLGDLAIRYGYQRYDTTVMLSVISILVALVASIQAIGDFWVARLHAR